MFLEKLWHRIRMALEPKSEVRREVEEELQLHLEMRMQEFLAEGLSVQEARRRARESFGEWRDIVKQSLDERGHAPETPRVAGSFGAMHQDLHYAIRMLKKSPLFTAAIVATLGIGIGANTAVFSVVNAVLLKPLPFQNPDRIVRIYQRNPSKSYRHMMNSPADLADLKTQNDIFQDVAVYRQAAPTLTGHGDPEQISVEIVTREFFDALGVAPTAGRYFEKNEDGSGQSSAVVISNALGRRLFGTAANPVGEGVTLDSNRYTIIGVMPDNFHFPVEAGPYQTQMWIGGDVVKREQASRGSRNLAAIARLKPNLTVLQAQSEINGVSARLAQAFPKTDAGWSFEAVPLHEDVVGDTRQPLLVLFAAVCLLLLIACANIANLLLARAAGRRKEIAIRAALGASRWRLVRQLLTESVLLAIAGGAAGTAAAWSGTRLLRASLPKDLPRIGDVRVNATVLCFALAISIAAGVLFGLIPAITSAKQRLSESLNEGRATTTGGFRLLRNHRSRSLMVIVQVALSVVLLAGSGLLAKSFLRLISVDLGFNPDHVLTFRIELPRHGYEKNGARREFFRQAVERFRTLPGVQAGALTSFLALRGSASTDYQVEGRAKPEDTADSEAGYKAISSDYFTTMHIPLFRGRFLTEQDTSSAPPVVVINRAFAAREFPNEDPIGKKLKLDWSDEPPWREIVGVVGDTRDSDVHREPRPQFYVPVDQAWASPSVAFVLRTAGDPHALIPSVRAAILSLDKNQPVSVFQTLDEIFSDAVAEPRFAAWLIGVFSLAALLLAAIGLYGVMAYSVVERTHEIGIRMAIGAEGLDVFGLIARQGIALVAVGLVIGVIAAVASARVLSSLLFGIRANDAATFIQAAALLAGVTLIACWIPSRRAARVDPIDTLRHE